jgi:hypothetical protein
MNNTATARPNTYAGPCATCGAHVAAAAYKAAEAAYDAGLYFYADATDAHDDLWLAEIAAAEAAAAAYDEAGHRRPVNGCLCCQHGVGIGFTGFCCQHGIGA